jgi:CheY-like chemotaxis protein
MPQMNGYELVKRISKLQNGIKVILMSAFEINHAEMARVLPNIKINNFKTHFLKKFDKNYRRKFKVIYNLPEM